jgi:hypothetical protein
VGMLRSLGGTPSVLMACSARSRATCTGVRKVSQAQRRPAPEPYRHRRYVRQMASVVDTDDRVLCAWIGCALSCLFSLYLWDSFYIWGIGLCLVHCGQQVKPGGVFLWSELGVATEVVGWWNSFGAEAAHQTHAWMLAHDALRCTRVACLLGSCCMAHNGRACMLHAGDT